ncbi:MAG TPA: SPOR domain-containing protein [Gemmatimonadaceae bacterium]
MQGRIIALGLLVLAACSGDQENRSAPVLAANRPAGPDPVVLRIARDGGTVRAFRYPDLDSLVWSSAEPASRPASVLAFDQENGLVALADRNGYAAWIDLRLGTTTPAPRTRLTLPASADAWAIYGIVRDTTVARVTPTDEWSFSPGGRVLRLFPQGDGDLVVLVAREDQGAMLLRLRPPESTVTDSATVPVPQLSTMSPLGDRLYLAVGRDLLALDANAFHEVGRVSYPSEIAALVLTPSGDRAFVATHGTAAVDVFDRYSGERSATIPLPGTVGDLRMDPLGRLLLARPDSGDSVWVVSVGTNQLVATLPSRWSPDLPSVSSDGLIVALRRRSVEFYEPGEEQPKRSVNGGANDFWHFAFWNGFRPRAAELDQPVVFPEDSSTFAMDIVRDSVTPAPPPLVDTAPPEPPVVSRDSAVAAPPASGEVWTVSFATVTSEQRARALADSINIDGRHPRVVVSTTAGVNLYRVVMGPFPSRSEAERVGRSSGRTHWVFQGTP